MRNRLLNEPIKKGDDIRAEWLDAIRRAVAGFRCGDGSILIEFNDDGIVLKKPLKEAQETPQGAQQAAAFDATVIAGYNEAVEQVLTHDTSGVLTWVDGGSC